MPFLLFWIHNIYTFLHKKIRFLSNIVFKYFINIVWLEITNTYTTKQSIIFFIK